MNSAIIFLKNAEEKQLAKAPYLGGNILLHTIKQLKKVNEYQRKAIESVKKQYEELELWKQEWQDAQIKANEEGFARTMLQIKNKELEKENEQLKTVCDYNCPVHKLATHNTCLTCSAVRNSPYHDLKDVSEEELQEIRNEAEKEAEM